MDIRREGSNWLDNVKGGACADWLDDEDGRACADWLNDGVCAILLRLYTSMERLKRVYTSPEPIL